MRLSDLRRAVTSVIVLVVVSYYFMHSHPSFFAARPIHEEALGGPWRGHTNGGTLTLEREAALRSAELLPAPPSAPSGRFEEEKLRQQMAAARRLGKAANTKATKQLIAHKTDKHRQREEEVVRERRELAAGEAERERARAERERERVEAERADAGAVVASVAADPPEAVAPPPSSPPRAATSSDKGGGGGGGGDGSDGSGGHGGIVSVLEGASQSPLFSVMQVPYHALPYHTIQYHTLPYHTTVPHTTIPHTHYPPHPPQHKLAATTAVT